VTVIKGQITLEENQSLEDDITLQLEKSFSLRGNLHSLETSEGITNVGGWVSGLSTTSTDGILLDSTNEFIVTASSFKIIDNLIPENKITRDESGSIINIDDNYKIPLFEINNGMVIATSLQVGNVISSQYLPNLKKDNGNLQASFEIRGDGTAGPHSNVNIFGAKIEASEINSDSIVANAITKVSSADVLIRSNLSKLQPILEYDHSIKEYVIKDFDDIFEFLSWLDEDGIAYKDDVRQYIKYTDKSDTKISIQVNETNLDYLPFEIGKDEDFEPNSDVLFNLDLQQYYGGESTYIVLGLYEWDSTYGQYTSIKSIANSPTGDMNVSTMLKTNKMGIASVYIKSAVYASKDDWINDIVNKDKAINLGQRINYNAINIKR
jgi:hypothetical protein